MKKSKTAIPLFPEERTPGKKEEFLPRVWESAENLTSPRDDVRRQALETLVALDAHRYSPLVAYLFATRLADPNLEVRFHVVQALGEVLLLRNGGDPAPEEVRFHLQGYISHLRKRKIYALLQVANQFGAAEESVAAIFNLCSFAGAALEEIFMDRKIPHDIRQQAIFFSGHVGFMDTVSSLKTLQHRIQSQHEDQTSLPFLNDAEQNKEEDLLIYVRAALGKLDDTE